MLELLWRAENTQADTRYKVLFPITTPLMPRPPHVIDSKSASLVLKAGGLFRMVYSSQTLSLAVTSTLADAVPVSKEVT